VSALRMRARRYREAIFAGVVFLPYERLDEVGGWVAGMVERERDPKMAFAVTNQGPGTGKLAQGARPGIVVYLFDANGEEHARSKEHGFGELLAMDGAELSGGMVPLSGMTKLADGYRSYQGVNKFWGSAPLLDEKVDAGLIARAWSWYGKSIEACPELDEGSTVLFEFGQEVCCVFVMHRQVGADNDIGLLQLLRLSDGISMAAFWTQAHHAGCAGL